MALNSTEEEKNENSIVVQREELMISLTDEDAIPTLRKAHFLNPLLNFTNTQPLPKPPLSLSSNPNTLNDLEKNFTLKCRKKPSEDWKTWVENLEQTHQSIWKKVGIFDAIRVSIYRISIDCKWIMNLAQKWCPQTNTFVFSWGECTITLEDIMILGGFSVLGDSVLSPLRCRNAEEIAIEAKLRVSCCEIRQKCCGHLAYHGWMSHFSGMGGELEGVAFLVMWLSRYVFCTNSCDISSNVFALAIRLARGTRIALAPAVLASIYKDLSLLQGKIVAKTNSSEDKDYEWNLVLWSQLQLVQVWAWERFRTISPKPVSLVHGRPRIARWHNVSAKLKDGFGLGFESSADFFLWRPYALYLENWEFPGFYRDKEMWVLINSEVGDEILSFARCLRACELVGVDCVEQYLPHRVGMQFGMDQNIPDFVPRINADPELAWRNYDKPPDGLECYVPPRLLDGDVTVEYRKWWRSTLACQSQRIRPRTLKILYKSMKPQLYSSQSCNKVLPLDCESGKDVLMKNSLPGGQRISFSTSSLVTETVSTTVQNHENGIGGGRTCEHTVMDVNHENEMGDGRTCEHAAMDLNHENGVGNERTCEHTAMDVNHENGIGNERTCEHTATDVNHENEIGNERTCEHTAVDVNDENGMENERICEHTAMDVNETVGSDVTTNDKSSCLGSSHTQISSPVVVDEAVNTKELFQGSETDRLSPASAKDDHRTDPVEDHASQSTSAVDSDINMRDLEEVVAKVVETICGGTEDSSKETLHCSSSIPCNLSSGLDSVETSGQFRNETDSLTADVEQGTAPTSSSLCDPLIIGIDNNDDDSDDELNITFRKLDLELESRIRKLEQEVSALMPAKFGSKSQSPTQADE